MNIKIHAEDSLRKLVEIIPEQKNFDGHCGVRLDDTVRQLKFGSEICVEADVRSAGAGGEGIKSIVSQWNLPEKFGSFEVCRAGVFTDMEDAVFYSAVFDGRYIYYSSAHRETKPTGNTVRYDSHKGFQSADAWENYDIGEFCDNFCGVAFDGKYVYYSPHRPQKYFVRYNTSLPFAERNSWEIAHVPSEICYQGIAFDGRHIYYVPCYVGKPDTIPSARIRRYDTTDDFQSPAAWEDFAPETVDNLPIACFEGAMFDGRYMYFIPLKNAHVLRFDTTGDFQSLDSYQAYDCSRFNMRWNIGSVFDGRYLYLTPHSNDDLVRYNTAMDFHDDRAWERFHPGEILGLSGHGYSGGFFDGRYVYYNPYVNYIPETDTREDFNGDFLRFDSTGDFHDPQSWSYADLSMVGGLATKGHNAGTSDGRYFYFAPIKNETTIARGYYVGHSHFLRYDTVGANAVFSLRFNDFGHNGGIGGSLPGPRFLVNTADGSRSIAANRVLAPGNYNLKGCYDGHEIKLYVNGCLVNSQAASGTIANSNGPLYLGGVNKGRGFFSGEIRCIRIANFIF